MNKRDAKRFEDTRLAFQCAVDSHYDKMAQAVEDLRFAFVAGAQWNGSDGDMFANRPKFENNTTAIAIQRIHGQYQRANFGIKVIPNSDEATDLDAEVLTSKYRDDFIKSDGVEADSNAALEAFTCGFGATLWTNRYENDENPNANRQYLCSEPIYSACSSVVFSANALRKDKSDAEKAWYLIRANREYIEREYGESICSYPQSTYDNIGWEWDATKDVYLAHVWEVVEKTFTDYIFPFSGLTITIGDGSILDQDGNEISRDIFNELKDIEEYDQIKRKVRNVEYSFQHGDGYLIKPKKTPFKRVPIIPRYGHYCVINGIEHFFGEVALKRDPQRFGNMLYSSLGQIASQNQIPLKEYLPAQVNRHKTTFENKDIENPPYLLTDPADLPDGSVAIGPVGDHQPPAIGSGLQAAIQINSAIKTEQEGTGQSTVPANTSASAVQQVNERQDDRYQALFQNQMYAIQAGARVYIPAAQEIYFSESRNIRVIGQDGQSSNVRTMQDSLSPSGDVYGPYAYCARGDYEIQVKMDEAYKDKKARELEESMTLLQYVDSNSPEGQMIVNQAIMATTSDTNVDLRRIARYNMIDIMLARGLQVEPKSQEEAQYIQKKQEEMNKPPEPTPEQQAMIQAAQAEAEARQMEGQAAIQNEINDATKNEISLLKAQNDQEALKIKAHEAGATINLKEAQAIKAKADAAANMAQKMAEG
jgi:hypothetical protein